jgi:hypothetical protein
MTAITPIPPRRRRVIAPLVAALGALVTAGVISAPGDIPVAQAAPALTIVASPALKPAFNPAITDYTARCGTSDTGRTNVTLNVHAPAGTKVSVAGTAPRTGAFTAKVARAFNQSFPIAVVNGGAAPTVYYVRCRPEDAPGIGIVKSGTSTAAYFLMSAHGAVVAGPVPGGFSTNYLDVVSRDGVPVWWFNTGTQLGETKVLPNGNLAWLPLGDPLEERKLDGTLVASINTPDAPAPDQHDFELLPNGNWLLVAYPQVSGVDMSSIGGSANTCIMDSELEEITPAGAKVWSWKASDHVPFTDISPNVRSAVSNSSCAAPKDVWHLNSEQVVGNDIVLSLRRTSAVYRINRTTGAVEWRLGSTPGAHELTIVGDPLGGTIGQHDARVWSDGTVSMFDNGDDGNSPPGQRRSRVVRYKIDTTAHTATMVEQVVDPKVSNPLGSSCCGSARRLPGGHWSIGYGAQGINTEVTSTGARVLSFNYGDTSTDANNPAPTMFTYRMDPVPPGKLSNAALRNGMDAMHPVADTSAPVVVANAADNKCSVPGKDGWCRGVQVAGFDAFDNAAGLSNLLCHTSTRIDACRFTVAAAKDGPKVMIASRKVCDLAATKHCIARLVVVGPFKIDATKPRLAVSAKTADGKAYRAGTATNQAVTLHYACSDATSGLVAGSCPADVTVSHPDGRTVTRTVTDKAGNTATSKVKIGS